MRAHHRRLFIGLMSGTSVDGVDAVVLSIESHSNTSPSQQPVCASTLSTLGYASRAFPPILRDAIQGLQTPAHDDLERAARVALDLAHLYAQAAREAMHAAGCTADQITAIGAHGQTVRHRPADGYTIQLLNAAQLAESTGIAVVHDFRPADIAAGGQGAPLVPAFHAAVFGNPEHTRAIVNIGGIANISVLPAIDTTGSLRVLGHDTGPGNTLLDGWHERHQGGAFDRDGAWAASGAPDQTLLELMLADPYFARRAPKSTGRDDFNLNWVDRTIQRYQSITHRLLSPVDVQATLAALSAHTIAEACQTASASQVFLCGGGVFNADLFGRIRSRLPSCDLRTTEALGIAPMAVEAAAFAWLAARRLDGLPGNLPTVTGASASRVLGSITDPLGRLAPGQ